MRPTQEPEIPGSIPGPATYFFLLQLNQEGQLSVTGESMCTKYILVNRLGGPSLPRKSLVTLTDRPNMTSSAVYHGRKTTTTQQNP